MAVIIFNAEYFCQELFERRRHFCQALNERASQRSIRFGPVIPLPTRKGRCVGPCVVRRRSNPQRLLHPTPNKHGKHKLCPLNVPTSNPEDQVPSPHYRTCKRRQDLYFAESVRYYRQSSCLPGRWRGTQSNLCTPANSVLLPPRLNLTRPSMSVSLVLQFSCSWSFLDSVASTTLRMSLCSPIMTATYFTTPADSRLVATRNWRSCKNLFERGLWKGNCETEYTQYGPHSPSMIATADGHIFQVLRSNGQPATGARFEAF